MLLLKKACGFDPVAVGQAVVHEHDVRRGGPGGGQAVGRGRGHGQDGDVVGGVERRLERLSEHCVVLDDQDPDLRLDTHSHGSDEYRRSSEAA